MGVGATLFLVIACVSGMAEDDPGISKLAAMIGFSIVMVPFGTVLGTIAGGFAQVIAVACRKPQPVMVRPMMAPARTGLPPSGAFSPVSALQMAPASPAGLGGGEWSRRYLRCRTSVRKFHAIVDATPPGPGRDWLMGIAADLNGELDEVLRLARYAHVLAPGPGDGREPTAMRIAGLLADAERGFASTVSNAGRIAVDLTANPDLHRIQAELAVLVEQAPHLRGSKGPGLLT